MHEARIKAEQRHIVKILDRKRDKEENKSELTISGRNSCLIWIVVENKEKKKNTRSRRARGRCYVVGGRRHT